jgi:hypothetical protein
MKCIIGRAGSPAWACSARLVVFTALLLAPAAASRAAAEGFRVTTDRTVDNSSLESIVRDVFRLSGAKTNDEKAIALLDYLHGTIFHSGYPVEKGGGVGPLKVINVYGWGLCGGQHTVLKALFEAAGWQVRYRGWSDPGHTTIEVFYDGKWHYLDVFLKAYFWTHDRKTLAGQDDIKADPSIALDAAKDGRAPTDYFLCCGDDAPGIVSGVKSSKPLPTSKPEDGWGSCTGRDQNYAPLLRLPSGGTLRIDWRGEPGMTAVPQKGMHTCGMKDFRGDKIRGPLLEHYGARSFANGTFSYQPDFAKAADAADIDLKDARAAGGKLVATGGGPGVAVFRLALPYAYVGGKIEAAFEGGDGALSISRDGGKKWEPAAAGNLPAAVKGAYDLHVKAEFPKALATFALNATIEHNRSAQPHLLNGRNAVTVHLADGQKLPEGQVLTVTYAYQEATAPANRTRFDGKGVRYGETKTVTKEVTSLPLTFDIEVGGNTPPKMLYLERSVRDRTTARLLRLSSPLKER